jgi:putative oxidoreductase
MLKQISLIAALGRILIALIFLISGYGKIVSPSATIAYIDSAHLPFPLLAYLVAIAVEIGGGVLLVLGLQTRIVAAIIALYCVASALGFHNNFADHGQVIHFLKNVSMTGGLLQVAAFGAGSLSIDRERKD